jgi:hypothetical protein
MPSQEDRDQRKIILWRTPLIQFACSINNKHGGAGHAQNAVCRGGAVRGMPCAPRSKQGLTLILMFDNEISFNHMKDMTLRAPMVGFITAAVVDEAQLDVAKVSGAGGGGTGLAGLDYPGNVRPIDRRDRDIFNLHRASL